MEQLSFFGDSGQSKGLPKELLDYHPGLFSEEQSQLFMEKLIRNAPWEQRIVKMYDKEVVTPRLTAWYGDSNVFDYTAFGDVEPVPWSDEL